MKGQKIRGAMAMVIASLSLSAQAAGVRKIDLSQQEATVEFIASIRPGSMVIDTKGGVAKGTLSISGKKLAGNLEVLMAPMSSGISLRDEHMKNKYLEIQKYPTATLKITEMDLANDPFAKSGKTEGVPFSGFLNVHGVEHAIAGTATIESTNTEVTVDAKTTTTLSDHHIEKPSYLGVRVDDKVEILAHLKIKK